MRMDTRPEHSFTNSDEYVMLLKQVMHFQDGLHNCRQIVLKSHSVVVDDGRTNYLQPVHNLFIFQLKLNKQLNVMTILCTPGSWNYEESVTG